MRDKVNTIIKRHKFWIILILANIILPIYLTLIFRGTLSWSQIMIVIIVVGDPIAAAVFGFYRLIMWAIAKRNREADTCLLSDNEENIGHYTHVKSASDMANPMSSPIPSIIAPKQVEGGYDSSRPQEDAPSMGQNKLFCSRCGKQLEITAIFCSGCGAPIGQASVQQYAQYIQQSQPNQAPKYTPPPQHAPPTQYIQRPYYPPPQPVIVNNNVRVGRQRHSILLDLIMIPLTGGLWIIWMILRR